MMNQKLVKACVQLSTLVLLLTLSSAQWAKAQQNENMTDTEEEIINLSEEKWQWMADKNVEALADLFHEKAEFVHMGGSWGTERELAIIESGGIWYKQADIHEVSVNIIDNTAILLNRITLIAEVGGNEVTNPFEVTEVYVNLDDGWKLGSLSFTRLSRGNDD
jgi:hypothetical protein